ncbi:hypothetical protein V496_05566 [Pseudogymnoascus sp. VKM F-4515 (FW-2607)]|nr:hypothetical protein V496_05566 [Pseudogymnoascus sp. VKM F-4515 (FW-2607)]KFY77202.1 hypothetical protein V498_09393 [Pseudogymnoascus sp. VKM F-4517 (FW-2822)]
MSSHPPPATSETPCPSSPTLSNSSWASSMLPSAPRGASPAPAEPGIQAVLQEREAALKKALEKLEDEKARLAQEKALRVLERKTNDLDRSNNDQARKINAATREELAREKVRVEARWRCNIPTHRFNGEVSELRAFVAMGVMAGCVIPFGYVVWTAVKVQVEMCDRAMHWVLEMFGM